MTMDLAEVLKRLSEAGIKVVKQDRLGNDKGYRVECSGGEIVAVYDTGTVVPQGANQELVKGILGLPGGTASVTAASPAPRDATHKNVFIVYGHEKGLRDELELLLRRWGLSPLILDQLPSEGATLIEKLERYTKSDIQFAIVLATADDVGCPKTKPDQLRPRARQNVVLELGMLLAKLDRKRVAILIPANAGMERPSDIDGLIYISFKDSIIDARADLAKEMSAAGIAIDSTRL